MHDARKVISLLFLICVSNIGMKQVDAQECCPKKEVSGMTDNENGVYTYMPNQEMTIFSNETLSPCLDKCVYTRNGKLDDFYCFEKIYTTPVGDVTCKEEDLIERMLVEEDGEIVQQSQRIDPSTGDISVQVEAHGSREDLEVVMNPESDVMTVISGDTCQIKKVPEAVELKAAETELNNTNVEDETVTQDTEEIQYSLTIEVGQSEQSEIDEMPLGGKSACEGKTISKTEEKPVAKDQFDIIESGGILTVANEARLMKRSSRTGNCTLERRCAKRGSGCWRWPYGRGFGLHSLTADVVCADCCSSGTSDEYCSCSSIKNLPTLQQCVRAENGTCPTGFYNCKGQCKIKTRGKMLRCGDECPSGMVSCGDYCLPSWMKNYRECGNECIGLWQSCNGTCTTNRTACGTQCVDNSVYEDYYRICNGKCQLKSKPCDGECPEGTTDCQNRCILEKFVKKYFWTCEGKCQSISKPCVGACPFNHTICGSRCLPNYNFDKYYWNCNDKCQPKRQICDGTCPTDHFLCGNQCVKNGDSKALRDCNGKCIYMTKACDGKCPENSVLCGNKRCIQPDSKVWKPCKDKCIPYNQPCEATLTTTPSSNWYYVAKFKSYN